MDAACRVLAPLLPFAGLAALSDVPAPSSAGPGAHGAPWLLAVSAAAVFDAPEERNIGWRAAAAPCGLGLPGDGGGAVVALRRAGVPWLDPAGADRCRQA